MHKHFNLWVLLLFLTLALPQSFANKNKVSHIRIKPRPGTVALTFDDGPSPKYTPKILKILAHYHVKATFFVMGMKAKRYPNLIKAIIAQGNVVTNHTMTHEKLTRLYGKKLYYQIVGANKIIEKLTGETPVCVRPPHGMVNRRIRNYIENLGLAVVMWDVNAFDYKRIGAKGVANRVIKQARGGSDILMHDGGGYSYQTVEALPHIIEALKKRHLGFDVICQPINTVKSTTLKTQEIQYGKSNLQISPYRHSNRYTSTE